LLAQEGIGSFPLGNMGVSGARGYWRLNQLWHKRKIVREGRVKALLRSEVSSGGERSGVEGREKGGLGRHLEKKPSL